MVTELLVLINTRVRSGSAKLMFQLRVRLCQILTRSSNKKKPFQRLLMINLLGGALGEGVTFA